ncbi:MAG: RES family NAD+ phosphorylase [Gammaproteobacteria bacterium]|nr:RES family NAD+ phosphorylase [Gammaproteobacteria bacterium]
MSATTWTPTALASESRPWAGSGWRAVEAQHQVASMRLVRGNLAEQSVLEQILDQAKPPLPQATAGLHWLLATPFRYPPLKYGSRFRRPFDPGVFYAGENRRTACAEAGYWRLQFWLDSAGLRERSAEISLTLFECHGKTQQALDLTRPPLNQDRGTWIHPRDYSGTQALAEAARAAKVELLRYASARLDYGVCLAMLSPKVFRGLRGFRGRQQGWTLVLLPPNRVVWQRNLGDESWEFAW